MNTLDYIIKEETKRQLLRIKASIRAVKSEKKLERKREREKLNTNILKECFKGIEKNRETKKGNKWEAQEEMYRCRN